MAKVRCKGTALQQYIASVYTALAQVISMDGPNVESEHYEADTLDNSSAGIPYESTGRTEGGSLSGELFYDPALDSHKDYLELLTTPPTTNESWKIVFSNSEEWGFDTASHSFSPTVALADGLKGSFGMKLDGIPTFPSGGSAT